jgi:hypothetical protein
MSARIKKAPATALSLLVLVMVAYALFTPLGPVPGVLIRGVPTPPPAQWGDTANESEILLRVPGIIPRVVTIWFVQVDGEIYVATEKNSGWGKMLGEGGPVHMRLGDRTYSLTASLASNPFQIAQAYIAKYDRLAPGFITETPEEAAANSSIYHLAKQR